MSNRRYNTQTRTKAMGGGMMRKGYMSGGQSKLDVNKDGKISAEDFKMLYDVCEHTEFVTNVCSSTVFDFVAHNNPVFITIMSNRN